MPTVEPAPREEQSRYQVRFDWGLAGLDRVAPAEITIVVDVLASGTDAELLASRAADRGAVVIRADLRTASAAADAAVAEQHRRAARTSIAAIAVGQTDASSGALRFAVEDLFGAGAVIDALAARGIDHSSPEAAAACEAFRGLRPALRHLLTASVTGQCWLEEGRRDAVLAAAEVDAAR
ncbi:phosphosulfolactate phosphohydrolase [Microbacterium sp. UBA837]|jgi:2-phosphosulfolactate phosphatase|uniref:phosphosulfolactate phosphohydrolase n=1 Tax=Microbacterium sp. UBA837 TaxID=1946956 RepID=UPI0025D2674E|nr:phosphosulfolactate phosphohydrolase [Microbacterium sp. UBA837]|tara:strand:- start:1356 stop:1895 length:540 start_codon:yes stop_codon:yes gene_type:complete